MISWIKTKISRIFCPHYWTRDLTATAIMDGFPIYGKGILKSWKCAKCGKQIYSFDEPVSFIDSK